RIESRMAVERVGALEGPVTRGNLFHLGDRFWAGRNLDDALAALAHRPDKRIELANIADRRRHRHAAMTGMAQRVGGCARDAPLPLASPTTRFISAISSAVGSLWTEASSPMTAVRTAECPTNTARLL